MSGKSVNTIEKYLRDVRAFALYLNGTEITKESVSYIKNKLITESYAVRSINSMLASLNRLSFIGCLECRVKFIKIQRQIYRSEEKELTKAEYMRLMNAAKKKGIERLNFLIKPYAEQVSVSANCSLIWQRSLKMSKQWFR